MISDEKKALAVMAHDLKGPLSAIVDLLNLVIKDYVSDPEEIKKLVGRATARAITLLQMVDDILDFSGLDDKTKLPKEKIGIHSLFYDSISMLQPYAEKRGITFHYDRKCDGNDGKILGNYTFLLRAINNIIMNAIKYSKEKGYIKFECKKGENEKEMFISIIDNGIGIPTEDLGKVFNIFERGKNARKNMDGSLGLGLALIKEIIDQHDGTIEIDSIENEGTQVTIKLPVYVEDINKSILKK